ncbi:MAG: hypothetical protein KF767_14705 [Bdellovibrionaceae bacterium]|nr:hypothetical protein [Pseudobdellovibrionaceae bacterium]
MTLRAAYFLTLKRVGVALFVWFIVTQIFDQWILRATHAAMMGDTGVQARVWSLAALSFVSSLLTPIVATLMVLAGWHQRPESPHFHVGDVSDGARPFPPPATDRTTLGFIRDHGGDLIREQLRAFGSIMMWSLLLIVPGIVRLFELAFLPWVVCFDAEYQKGRRDALKESRRVFYRVWPRLLGLLILFWVIFPLTLTSLDERRSYFDSPLTAIGLTGVDVLLFILLQWLLLKLWERAHGTQLQVDGH